MFGELSFLNVGRAVVLTEVLFVNVPGSVTLPVTKNVLALEIPATVNSPLKAELAIPVRLFVLVTFSMITFPANRKIVWKFCSVVCSSTIPVSVTNETKVSHLSKIGHCLRTRIELKCYFSIINTSYIVGLLKNISISRWS